MLDYQSFIFEKDFESANQILPSIPTKYYNDLAKFLEGQGFLQEAYEVVKDLDHKFSLAIELNRLEEAKQMIWSGSYDEDLNDKQQKWRQIGDLSLQHGELELAQVKEEVISSNAQRKLKITPQCY